MICQGAQPIVGLLALILVLAGLVAAVLEFWSAGIAMIGVGCVLGGFGGFGTIETPVGKISAGAGVLLLIVAFAISQIFHR